LQLPLAHVADTHNPWSRTLECFVADCAIPHGTRKLRLILGGCRKMEFLQTSSSSGASDADWAGEQEQKIFRTGYVIFMGHAAVCGALNYKSQLLSSEAEAIALTANARHDLVQNAVG
jgi:hypothetical protein